MAKAALSSRGREAKATGTQAISRALAMLQMFQDVNVELSVAQVASALDLRPSTAHRILRALLDSGYLAQSAHTERYYLGRSAVLLGLAAQRGLGLQEILLVLEDLRSRTSESVNLAVREDTSALILLHVSSPMALRFDQPPGTRVPLHASSTGKALLAFGGDVNTYFDAVGKTLMRFTDSTITNIKTLRTEIARTRERGYSIDREESIIGARCVGVPVLDEVGTARAALAIQGPSTRMTDENTAALVPELQSAARKIALFLPRPL